MKTPHRSRAREFLDPVVFVVLTLCAGIQAPAHAQQSCVDPPAGIVSWWRGEGNAIDTVGTNHGTSDTGVSFAAGLSGKAFSFDGVQGFVSNTQPGLTNIIASYTVEFWAWPKAARALTPEAVEGTDGTLDQRYAIFPHNGRYSGYAGSGISVGTNGISVFEHAAAYLPSLLVYEVVITNWTHIALVYSNRQPSLFLNGNLVKRGLVSSMPSYPSTCLGETGLDYGYYAGLLDEISIYGRALQASEVRAIYDAASLGKCPPGVAPEITIQPTNQTVSVGMSVLFAVGVTGTGPMSFQWFLNQARLAIETNATIAIPRASLLDSGIYAVRITNAYGSAFSTDALLTVTNPGPACASPPGGLVSWWPGEGDAQDAVDGNDGVPLGGVSFTTGNIGQCFHLDGVTSYIRVPDAPNLDFTNAMTVELWASPRIWRNHPMEMVSKWEGPWNQRSYTLSISATPGTIGHAYLLVSRDGGYSGTGVLYSEAPIPTGQWTHIAAVYDGKDLQMYVNGVLDATTPWPYGFWSGAADLILGSTDASGSYFDGDLDEISLYNRALTSSEIEAIYRAGKAGKCHTPAPPVITQHPVSQRAGLGTDVTLTVAAEGSPPLSYQWLFKGSLLPGESRTTLLLSKITTNQAGVYAVQVTNQFGTAHSSNATISVFPLGLVLFDDFDEDIDAVQWAAMGGGPSATNYGGWVSPSNSLWFGGTGSRFAATRSLDTLGGGLVEFDLRLSGGGSNAFWETVDLPGDGVVLEWSTNSGSRWVEMGRYDTSAFFAWTHLAVPMPTQAQATNTQIRWRQLANSGPNYDHWALDNVQISTAPTPPRILIDPQDQSTFVGNTAVLSVVASGTAPLDYQWIHNEKAIPYGTNVSLVLTNVQLDDSGRYSVTVANSEGSVSSAEALLAVTVPPALLRVPETTGVGGANLTVPVLLSANGNENALSFSIQFDTNLLTYSAAVLGNSAAHAVLMRNATLLNEGKLGISLALPSPLTFPPGTQEIVRLSFTVVAIDSAVTTAISFIDQPLLRQISDGQMLPLPAVYSNATVAIQPVLGFEADVYPRPNGDRKLAIHDYLLMGRYAARLDSPVEGLEFQIADCAPQAGSGDGVLRASDWVQAGRYYQGLDSLTAAGGPSNAVPAVAPAPSLARFLSVSAATLLPGQSGGVTVSLSAQGDENALGVSLVFDPGVVSWGGASLGADATGGALLVNTNQAAQGRVGLVLALGTGTVLAPGNREVVKVNLRATAGGGGQAALGFGDEPVVREVSSVLAESLPVSLGGSTIIVQGAPALRVELVEQGLALYWPLWAGSYVLQEAQGDLLVPANWKDSSLSTGTTNGENRILAPLAEERRFYRLRKR